MRFISDSDQKATICTTKSVISVWSCKFVSALTVLTFDRNARSLLKTCSWKSPLWSYLELYCTLSSDTFTPLCSITNDVYLICGWLPMKLCHVPWAVNWKLKWRFLLKPRHMCILQWKKWALIILHSSNDIVNSIRHWAAKKKISECTKQQPPAWDMCAPYRLCTYAVFLCLVNWPMLALLSHKMKHNCASFDVSMHFCLAQHPTCWPGMMTGHDISLIVIWN